MKTPIKILFVGLLSILAPALQAQIYADDYVLQKQYAINGRGTCQAVRIHQDWFLTAAHCVEKCVHASCQIRLFLAMSDSAMATADLSSSDVIVPHQFQEKQTALWDVALLHYRPNSYEFRSEGGPIDEESFLKIVQKDPALKRQWQGAVDPEVPALAVYTGPSLMHLIDNIIVPRWEMGHMTYLNHPEYILYVGKKQALWVTDGFGVSEGNSGGGVWLENGNLVGIVSAKKENDFPNFARAVLPQLGQAGEFFLFTGFSKKTTLPFIQNTLRAYGADVKTTKLKQIREVLPPEE